MNRSATNLAGKSGWNSRVCGRIMNISHVGINQCVHTIAKAAVGACHQQLRVVFVPASLSVLLGSLSL
jgi:hypothetical protein